MSAVTMENSPNVAQRAAQVNNSTIARPIETTEGQDYKRRKANVPRRSRTYEP